MTTRIDVSAPHAPVKVIRQTLTDEGWADAEATIIDTKKHDTFHVWSGSRIIVEEVE